MKYQLPTGYLSPSQIMTHQKCGMQYHFIYIKRMRRPPAVAMEEGSCHHIALEFNNTYKIKQHKDRKAKSVLERFMDEFSVKKKTIEDWGDQTPKKVEQRGKILVPKYFKRFAPYYQPLVSEQRMKVLIQDVPFLCILDTAGHLRLPIMVNKRNTVVDYKVTGKSQSLAMIDSSIQLSSYGWLAKAHLGIENPIVGFCNLKKTKVPVIEWKPGVITGQRLRWFKRMVLDTATQIHKGNFPLSKPDEWWCSERFCGFWPMCRGKKQSMKTIRRRKSK